MIKPWMKTEIIDCLKGEWLGEDNFPCFSSLLHTNKSLFSPIHLKKICHEKRTIGGEKKLRYKKLNAARTEFVKIDI